jgi:hypothetical protein
MADGWSWYIGGDYDAWKTTPPEDEEDDTEEEDRDA